MIDEDAEDEKMSFLWKPTAKQLETIAELGPWAPSGFQNCGGEIIFQRLLGGRLMAIAHDKRLSKRTHVSLSPPHWGTLYEISRLDDERRWRLRAYR
jgi:hypothetical protein